jgi:hypothetical protein
VETNLLASVQVVRRGEVEKAELIDNKRAAKVTGNSSNTVAAQRGEGMPLVTSNLWPMSPETLKRGSSKRIKRNSFVLKAVEIVSNSLRPYYLSFPVHASRCGNTLTIV